MDELARKTRRATVPAKPGPTFADLVDDLRARIDAIKRRIVKQMADAMMIEGESRAGVWIDVQERMPRKGALVILYGQYFNLMPRVTFGRYLGKPEEEWASEEGYACGVQYLHNVTHWMPMPAPPAEEPAEEPAE